MHRSILIFGSLVVTRTVLADPVQARCDLTISRAPDDVRTAILEWAHAEPRCHSLDVRVVPTDGGFYILARADDGRTYDRVVPDADSAAALIVSWAADDSINAPPVVQVPVDINVNVNVGVA